MLRSIETKPRDSQICPLRTDTSRDRSLTRSGTARAPWCRPRRTPRRTVGGDTLLFLNITDVSLISAPARPTRSAGPGPARVPPRFALDFDYFSTFSFHRCQFDFGPPSSPRILPTPRSAISRSRSWSRSVFARSLRPLPPTPESAVSRSQSPSRSISTQHVQPLCHSHTSAISRPSPPSPRRHANTIAHRHVTDHYSTRFTLHTLARPPSSLIKNNEIMHFLSKTSG